MGTDARPGFRILRLRRVRARKRPSLFEAMLMMREAMVRRRLGHDRPQIACLGAWVLGDVKTREP